jgi:hypothetical protein
LLGTIESETNILGAVCAVQGSGSAKERAQEKKTPKKSLQGKKESPMCRG